MRKRVFMNGDPIITATVACFLFVIMATHVKAESVAFNVKDLNGNNIFTVTDTAKITLGVDAPTTSAINVKGNSVPSTQIVSHSTSSNPLGGGGFIAYHNRENASLPVAEDRLGYYLFGSMEKSLEGDLPRNSAGIAAFAESSWTGSSTPFYPTYLSFLTTAESERFERVRITASGNVGIGTKTPATQLHVVKDTSQGGSIVFLDGYEGDGISNGPNIAIRQSRGSISIPASTKSNDIVGQVNFRGRGPSGFAPIRRAGVLAYATEDYTDTAQGTKLTLATTANGTAMPVDQVFVLGNGNVGVGAESPTQKLEVNGGLRLNSSAARPTCNADTRGTFWVSSAEASDAVLVCLLKRSTGEYKWKVVVSSEDDEHEPKTDGSFKHKDK